MENKKIHFLGIGGISQSALALILKNKGHIVSGSDKNKSAETDRLVRSGIDVTIDGISKHIKDADMIVVSAAIKDDDQELLLAKKLGKTIFSRAQMLGKIARTFEKTISVAGSHGKTTTTGMIAKIFVNANKNPTVHVGGNLPFIDQNVRIGGNKYFITEACEYVDSFLQLESDVSVILNVQKDHLDYFKTFSNIKKSFKQFAKNTKQTGLVVYCADDKNAIMKFDRRNVGFSMCDSGVITAKNIQEYVSGKFMFDCYFLGKNLGKIRLGTFGKHNVSNALASVCVAIEENIDFKIIQQSIEEFTGAKRRFECYGDLFGTILVHDYAHHPTEIKATIDLAKEVAGGDVFVIFQPHTYSRTKLLMKDFKTCFHGAKEVLVFKTYSAREKPEDGADQNMLANELVKSGENAHAFESYLEMLKYIFPKLKPNDMLLVLGAGDIENFLPFVLGKYSRFENIYKK